MDAGSRVRCTSGTAHRVLCRKVQREPCLASTSWFANVFKRVVLMPVGDRYDALADTGKECWGSIDTEHAVDRLEIGQMAHLTSLPGHHLAHERTVMTVLCARHPLNMESSLSRSLRQSLFPTLHHNKFSAQQSKRGFHIMSSCHLKEGQSRPHGKVSCRGETDVSSCQCVRCTLPRPVPLLSFPLFVSVSSLSPRCRPPIELHELRL
jgi:hypothetical protein